MKRRLFIAHFLRELKSRALELCVLREPCVTSLLKASNSEPTESTGPDDYAL